MLNASQNDNYMLAAIVCHHVAVENCEILRAIRDEPTMVEDSGWQFLCNTHDVEDSNLAKVWLIKEVLEHTPSLMRYLDLPPGTILTREREGAEWVCSLN